MWKRGSIILAVIVVVALPFFLRPPSAITGPADETLVIITPHNEAIRHEYTQAFRRWYRARTGKTVAIDWRVIGGSSEIARFLESEYVAAFQNHWVHHLRRPWSVEVQAAFHNGRLPGTASADERAARQAFLASEVSCGIDLFFGGGSYDFIRQAQAGQMVRSAILDTHPEWFRAETIPQSYAGEPFWDKDGCWFGDVLSCYGILYNQDALRRLGVTPAPAQWSDLTDPRLFGEVALCDPTKSASIAKAFENLLQQQMQQRLHALEARIADPQAREAQAVREGWLAGLRLLQLMGANARYFTDSSQKPPIDVAQGNSAVGVCIDFYGRYQAEAVTRRDGSARLEFVVPHGGTVNSVDPIGIMRGAPHRAVAEAFIEFALSMEGQQLWNFKTGTPAGPERFALRRLPVRRDFYTQVEWKPLRSDPEVDPFNEPEQLIYRPEWTSGVFREMAFIMRVMCIDTHTELQAAWRAVIAAGQPPAALAALQDLSAVDYEQTRGAIKQALASKNKVDEVRLARELGNRFRAQYRRAQELAEAAR